MADERKPRKRGVWTIRLGWALVIVVLYGGVIWLDSLLHPNGKHDPKAIPIALFALATVVIGGGLVARMSRK